jgi:hypothetical protein
VWELRSVPGNLVACAATQEAAVAKLHGKLARSFERAGSALAWYQKAINGMSEEDKKDESRLLEEWFRKGGDFVPADGYAFAQVQEPRECEMKA